MNRDYRQTVVTEFAVELVRDLEGAMCALFAAPAEDQQAVNDCYARVCQQRKALYNYIESLERGIEPLRSEPRTRLRFD